MAHDKEHWYLRLITLQSNLLLLMLRCPRSRLPRRRLYKLQEAIQLDEYDYHSHYELLKVLIRIEEQSEALNLVGEMNARPAKDSSITQLEAMLIEFSKWNNSIEYFEKVFHTLSGHEMFQNVLQIIERAITSARQRKADHVVIDLLLCQGVALAKYNSDGKHHDSAVTQWTEAYTLGFKSGLVYSARSAARHAFNHYFSKVRASEAAFQVIESSVEKVEALAESTSIPDIAPGLRLLLAGFYMLIGKQDAAQKLLVDDLKTGINLLSDNDPENDYLGYAIIANVLMHTGDDLNALSAWSLYGPLERRKEYAATQTQDDKEVDSLDQVPSPKLETSPSESNIARFCDGECSKSDITWEDSVWMCKVCDDVDFNDECLLKLRRGTLMRFVCSADH